MSAQRDALLRLLNDDDPPTLALVKGHLLQRGHAGVPELRDLLAAAPPTAARHLSDVIARIESEEASAVFGKFCAGFGEGGDLEEAAWLLAAAFLPGEDFTRQRDLLNTWGAEVKRRLKKAATPVDQIETLVEFLAHDVGLRGNEEDYENINNSILPEIIETHLGIPITLSLVYILVGRRAGIAISGAGLPGHFLIRHGHDFFDPFNKGKRVGLEECRERLSRLKLTLKPEHLEPVTPPQFLLRMLANIHALAAKCDPPLAAEVEGWMEALRTAATG
jgi:regulator of sirC expression with transglutaminase-like and TPR domain